MTGEPQDNPLLGALVGALSDPVFVIDEDGRYVQVLGGNGSRQEHERALVGRSLHDVLPEAVADGLMASIRAALTEGGTRVEEYRIDAADAGAHWYQARIAPIAGAPGEPRRVAYLAMDITARKRLEQELQDALLTDPLTEVGNERQFTRVFEREVARQGRYKEPFCLLLLQVDHFDPIEETFGEDIAHACLRETARLIRQELRHSDVLARIDRSEFAVLLVNTTINWGLEVGERIRTRIARMPYTLPKRTLHLTVSGGVTDFRNGDTTSAMLYRAEKALHKSENAGHDRVSVS